MLTRTAPLVAASSLPAGPTDAIAGHADVIVARDVSEAPWEVGPGVEALFTHQSQWGDATRPPGWPFDLKWLHTTSAGVEILPDWVFEVPLVTRGCGIQDKAIAEYVIAAVFAREKSFLAPPVTKREDWQPRKLGDVSGKVLGIAGLGDIGLATARLGLAVGMRVKALVRRPRPMPEGIEMAASLATLAGECDHLVLSLPLTTATRGILNADVLSGARPGLHVINVARGALIDDAALLEALDTGTVGGATLDATWPEPPPDGHPYYTHPKVTLTPHVCGVTPDADRRLASRLAGNIDRYLAGDDLSGAVDHRSGY
ncbi:NAD(P)-dependent oxidoreductase [Pelagovum pacificum]|uniref:NAD(P)-dependent oxidoreductase n=1 Tax=Pelagovum pacificum TaxID=2588711 RepID=UPI0018CDFFA0|nr:NAD(P)-dependent oxidoreductase [Pelagovum pacificum]QQA44247.1 glyoxylate reductase (NADP(+)) [Pelagovum pacificum]